HAQQACRHHDRIKNTRSHIRAAHPAEGITAYDSCENDFRYAINENKDGNTFWFSLNEHAHAFQNV
ncbi:MAG: hypothetical protein ACXWJE_07960, partial [Burkholderiaceae bacterium]